MEADTITGSIVARSVRKKWSHRPSTTSVQTHSRLSTYLIGSTEVTKGASHSKAPSAWGWRRATEYIDTSASVASRCGVDGELRPVKHGVGVSIILNIKLGAIGLLADEVLRRATTIVAVIENDAVLLALVAWDATKEIDRHKFLQAVLRHWSRVDTVVVRKK